MSEGNSSRKKTRMAAAKEASKTLEASKDPKMIPTNPRLAPKAPKLTSTDPKLASKNPTMKEAEKEGDAPMQRASNGRTTLGKRARFADNALSLDQVANQDHTLTAPTTFQKSGINQFSNKEKEKETEIKELKGQVEFYREKARKAQKFLENSRNLALINAEMEIERSLLKSVIRKLAEDLAAERRKSSKLEIEVAVAKEQNEKLRDVEKILNYEKTNNAKMKQKMIDLEGQMGKLENEIATLKKTVQDQTEKIGDLQTHKIRVENLEETLAKLQIDASKHESEKMMIRDEKLKLEGKIEVLMEKTNNSAWNFWGLAPRNATGPLSNGNDAADNHRNQTGTTGDEKTKALELEIAQLKSQVSNQSAEMTRLQQSVEGNQQENTSLKNENQQLRGHNSQAPSTSFFRVQGTGNQSQSFDTNKKSFSTIRKSQFN